MYIHTYVYIYIYIYIYICTYVNLRASPSTLARVQGLLSPHQGMVRLDSTVSNTSLESEEDGEENAEVRPLHRFATMSPLLTISPFLGMPPYVPFVLHPQPHAQTLEFETLHLIP